MTLRKRALVIILLTVTLLLGSLYLFVDLVVLEDFRRIETATIFRHVQQVTHAFKNTEKQLAAKVVDWAAWDDTYEFIEHENEKYTHETLNFLTLAALKLRHLVYFDIEGKPKNAYEVFYRQQRVESIPDVTLKLLLQAPRPANATDSTVTGLLRLDESLVLFVSSPILDSKREKPSRGALLGTIDVNPAMLREIASQTNLSLTAFRLGVDQLGAPERQALEALAAGKSPFIREVGDTMLHGYGLIRDISNEPALLFRVDDPRTIYRQALTVRSFMLGSLGIAGVLWTIVTWWLFNSWILRPITLLGEQVRNIALAGSTSLRLSELKKGVPLKNRAIIILGVTMVLMNVALSFIFSRALTSQFESIEQADMLDNVGRALRAIDDKRSDLMSKTIDWAQWDDTYRFITEQHAEYDESNLNYETLAAIRMSHVLYYDTTPRLVTGRLVDSQAASADVLSADDNLLVAPFESLLHASKDPHSGYVQSKSGLLLAAMSPILDSNREKPSRGYFVFATPMDSAFTEALAQQTELNLRLVPPTFSPGQSASQGSRNDSAVERRGEAEIVGIAPLKDSAGNEVMRIEVSSPRDMYRQGIDSRNFLTLWLIGVSIIFLVVTIYAIQRWVIARVEILKRELLQAGSGTYQKPEENTANRDELSRLSNDINSMLQALNQAQEEVIQARDAAQAANHAKSDFIAKVSHELRTPIHSIIGMLRISLKQEENPSRRSHLGMARDAAYSLLGTINDILDFSKAEAGMLTITPVDFSLRRTVRESLRTVGPRVYEREGLELLCEMDASLTDSFVGDPLRLKQVFINLLGNSAKFTNSGYIKLFIGYADRDSDKPTLRFEVTDTGIGIPADRLPTIFAPFTQADNSAVRRYQGTGLGLTIVKQLVEAMGGTISVQSTVGSGTCFTILLPLQRADENVVNQSGATLAETPVILLDHCDQRRDYIADMFRAQKSNTILYAFPATPPTKALVVVTGELLSSEEVWGHVQRHAQTVGPDSILALLTPYQLTLREKLHNIGVKQIINRPVLPSDVLQAASGEFVPADANEDLNADAPSRHVGSLKILIADDTPTNQIILRDLLEEAGHQVTSVSNGQQLFDLLQPFLLKGQAAPFDLVLTDVQMPEMDGITATRKLRELERRHAGPRLPIAAVTAHAFPEERKRILEAGADGVVIKPIEPRSLTQVVLELSQAKQHAATAKPDATPPQPTTKPGAPSAEQLFNAADQALKPFLQVDTELDLEAPADLLDIQALYKRSGDSPRRTLLILGAFESGHDDLLERLNATRANQEPKDLRNVAHALRGALLEAGATKIAEIATKMEHLCDNGQYEDAVALRDSLERGMKIVVQAVKQIRVQAGH